MGTPAITFASLGVDERLAGHLEANGYITPRAVQVRAIPELLAGRDLIGLAPTGSGKTAAFGVPMIQAMSAARLVGHRGGGGDAGAAPIGLILCPTRELARQVAGDVRRFAGGRGRVVCVYGKVGIVPQEEDLRRGADIVVATPGRARELAERGTLDLSGVAHVVIDEADRMFDLGFLPQVSWILARMQPEKRIALFTATMPRDVEKLVREHLKEPVRVETAPQTRPAEHLAQRALRVRQPDKVDVLLGLLRKTDPGVLVFCRTRRRVGWVGTALRRQGFPVAIIHGDRTQPQRLRALDKFEAGEVGVIVATDVAARGLHLERVHTVINYDLPGQVEDFVHRVGRAGHGGGAGQAITFVDPRDDGAWRDFAKALDLGIPVEATAGSENPRPKRGRTRDGDSDGRGKRGPAKRRKAGAGIASSGRTMKKGGRRRAAKRPIGRDQKPGSGVRRPAADGTAEG